MAPAAGRVSGLPAAEAADGRGADQREHAGAGQRPPRAHTLVGAVARRHPARWYVGPGDRRGCGSSHLGPVRLRPTARLLGVLGVLGGQGGPRGAPGLGGALLQGRVGDV